MLGLVHTLVCRLFLVVRVCLLLRHPLLLGFALLPNQTCDCVRLLGLAQSFLRPLIAASAAATLS
jgi:hypothetical protein